MILALRRIATSGFLKYEFSEIAFSLPGCFYFCIPRKLNLEIISFNVYCIPKHISHIVKLVFSEKTFSANRKLLVRDYFYLLRLQLISLIDSFQNLGLRADAGIVNRIEIEKICTKKTQHFIMNIFNECYFTQKKIFK